MASQGGRRSRPLPDLHGRKRIGRTAQFRARVLRCGLYLGSGLSMPGSVFKIIVGGGDRGSPMANEATFDNLEEAQAEARSYLERQRKAGASLNVAIEEKAPDGIVKHGVD